MEKVDIIWRVKEDSLCDWVTVSPMSGTGNTTVIISVDEEAPLGTPDNKLTCDIIFETISNDVTKTTKTCVKRCKKECSCDDLVVTSADTLSNEAQENVKIGNCSSNVEGYMDNCAGKFAFANVPNWIHDVYISNGDIIAQSIDANTEELLRESAITITYSNGECGADLKIKQFGSRCICEEFEIRTVGTLTETGDTILIGTYDNNSCFKEFSAQSGCEWVLNDSISFANGNITATITNEGSTPGETRTCRIDVSFVADVNPCTTYFTVSQKIEECNCNKISTTPNQIPAGKYKLITYTEENDNTVLFIAHDELKVGKYDILGDCIDETKLRFEAQPDDGRTKVCVNWHDNAIYVTIDGEISAEEMGKGVKINTFYDNVLCEDSSFYIETIPVNYDIKLIGEYECGGGEYTFKATKK